MRKARAPQPVEQAAGPTNVISVLDMKLVNDLCEALEVCHRVDPPLVYKLNASAPIEPGSYTVQVSAVSLKVNDRLGKYVEVAVDLGPKLGQ